MPESAALQSRRIVVTRSGEAGAEFAAQLRQLGAEPILAPAITIRPPDDYGPLDAAIAALATYDAVVFTSANGVRAFLDRLHIAGKHLSALVGLRCGAVGPATARALIDAGRAPDVIPDTYTAEALAASLGDLAGQRILLPAADIARPTLADGLRRLGNHVDVVIAYRTVAGADEADARLAELLRVGAIDAVTFTSPSTVRGFLGLISVADLGHGACRPAIVCIGPTTAEAAREADLPVDAVATAHTVAGLIAALIDYYTDRPFPSGATAINAEGPTQGA